MLPFICRAFSELFSTLILVPILFARQRSTITWLACLQSTPMPLNTSYTLLTLKIPFGYTHTAEDWVYCRLFSYVTTNRKCGLRNIAVPRKTIKVQDTLWRLGFQCFCVIIFRYRFQNWFSNIYIMTYCVFLFFGHLIII